VSQGLWGCKKCSKGENCGTSFYSCPSILDDETEQEQSFTTTKTTPLGSLFRVYAHKNNLRVEKLRFMYRGNILQDQYTSKSIGLKDEAQLVCYKLITITMKDTKSKLKAYYQVTHHETLHKTFASFAGRRSKAQGKNISVGDFAFTMQGKTLSAEMTVSSLPLTDNNQITCVCK